MITQFTAITEAYNILKNEDTRNLYDLEGMDGIRGQNKTYGFIGSRARQLYLWLNRKVYKP